MKHQSKATSERIAAVTGAHARTGQDSPRDPHQEVGFYLACSPGAGKSALALRMVAALAGIGGAGGDE